VLVCQSPASAKRSSARSGCREWLAGMKAATEATPLGMQRGIRDGVRVRWPPWCAGISGMLPASTSISILEPRRASWPEHEAAEVVPDGTQLCPAARPRRPRERALQARFGCLQIRRYTPLMGAPVGQKAETTGQYSGFIPTRSWAEKSRQQSHRRLTSKGTRGGPAMALKWSRQLERSERSTMKQLRHVLG
jgi:hypothetical protein